MSLFLHQPGSQPINIPEEIPNPAYEPHDPPPAPGAPVRTPEVPALVPEETMNTPHGVFFLGQFLVL